ncbi:MAG: hypothetical protein WCF18_15795 [Chthoniobacteraceae bacterium]
MTKLTRILALATLFGTLAALPAHATKQHICPVSGDILGGDAGPPVEYSEGGKTVLFCCKSCVKKYKANPQKFAAAVQKAIAGS